MGLNQMEKTLIMGECKWSPNQMSEDILESLAGKTNAVVPTQGNWKILYVGMARGGWSRSAQEAAGRITSRERGKNWQATNTVLVDLTQIDEDLSSWSD